MKKSTILFKAITAGILLTGGHFQTEGRTSPVPIKPLHSVNQSLNFTENKGQIKDQHGKVRSDLDFHITADRHLSMFIGKGKIHYQWFLPSGDNKNATDPVFKMYRMDVELLNANPDPIILKEGKRDARDYYYTNTTSSANRSTFEKITYKNIYPCIDWVFYFNKDGNLEHDFVIHPGGSVTDIQIKYTGADKLNIQEDGSLVANTPFGLINESAPFAYQEDGKQIAASFQVKNDILSFKAKKHKGKLTIDPVLKWGTYYGPPSPNATQDDDYGSAVATDDLGNVYFCGTTTSTKNIATTGAHETVFSGYRVAFLVKFNCAGERVWGTYYGGDALDKTYGNSVAIDQNGNIYMSGTTDCKKNIATAGSHKENIEGEDAFLVKFDSSGKRIWGTYFGGPANETSFTSLACDANNNIYLSGTTASASGIATSGAFQSNRKGSQDGFLAKFDTDGNLTWSTYYGGEAIDRAASVSCDKEGYVYLAGATASKNDSTSIASPGAHRTSLTGVAGGKGDPTYPNDGFLAKFSSEGQRIWGTYFGGDLEDQITGIINDQEGNIYITGSTNSLTGIASTGSYQPAIAGQQDGFVAKFDPSGKQLWGTYYGDVNSDETHGITCDLSNNVIVMGRSNEVAANNTGTSLATPGSHQPQHGGWYDVIIAQFDPTGKRIWATYYGGTGGESGNGARSIGSDGFGNIYITGQTGSQTGIATPGSFEPTGGVSGRYTGGDAYLARFSDSCALLAAPTAIASQDSFCINTQQSLALHPICDISKYAWLLPPGWIGNSETDIITFTPTDYVDGAVIQVAAINACGDTGLYSSIPVNIYPHYPPTITVDGFTLGENHSDKHISWQWFLNGEEIPRATDSTLRVKQNGHYFVVVEDSNGCIDTSAVYEVTNIDDTNVPVLNNLTQQINIYPNPAEDVIHIKSPIALRLILTSVEGRIISRLKDQSEMNLKDLAPGIYLLKIADINGTMIKTEKIIKH